MLFSGTTYIGVDPTAGQKPFVFAALDAELRLLALGQGEMDEALAFAAGQRQAVIGVCAPRRPNRGLMDQAATREQLNPMPRPGRWNNFRVAEYLLRQHNISSPKTAARIEDCPGWMRMGFQFYRRLESIGYATYPNDECHRQTLEVYPHAGYTVLLGQTPFPKHTLEGRLQRQLILHEMNIHVPDPMRFFEEITRHRLLKGILPDESVYSANELDALVAAYTAWLAVQKPDEITRLGDPQEGEIILPGAGIKSHY